MEEHMQDISYLQTQPKYHSAARVGLVTQILTASFYSRVKWEQQQYKGRKRWEKKKYSGEATEKNI